MSDARTARMVAAVFNRLGLPGWWLDRATNGRTALVAIIDRPGADDLVGRAPMSVERRLIDLPAAAMAAQAGDLVAQNGRTWVLGGVADPDLHGEARRWIATAFDGSPSYHASGYPLLTWNGAAWVTSP